MSAPTTFADAMRCWGLDPHPHARCRSALYPARLSFPPYELMQHKYQSHFGMSWSEQPSNELDRVRLSKAKLTLMPAGRSHSITSGRGKFPITNGFPR